MPDNSGPAIPLPVIPGEDQTARLDRSSVAQQRPPTVIQGPLTIDQNATKEATLGSMEKAFYYQQAELDHFRQQQYQQLQWQNQILSFQNGVYHPNSAIQPSRSLVSSTSSVPLASVAAQTSFHPSWASHSAQAHAGALPHVNQPANGVHNALTDLSKMNNSNHTTRPTTETTATAASGQMNADSLSRRSNSGGHRLFNGGTSKHRRQAKSRRSRDDESEGGTSNDDDDLAFRRASEMGLPLVQWIAEWTFPPGTEDKHDFVTSSLRRGLDAEVIQNETAAVVPPRKKRKNIIKRKNLSNDDNFVLPIVTGERFDTRFIEYDRTPEGKLKMEKLVKVQASKLTIKDENGDHPAWGIPPERCIEEIPDEPPRPKTASRVGPLYEALLPERYDAAHRCDDLERFPDPEMIWDPKLATEAELRGEDVEGFLSGKHELWKKEHEEGFLSGKYELGKKELEEGFLSGNHELCNKELLMRLLHENAYNVELAKARYDKVTNLCGDRTTKFTRKEARLFEAILREKGKDFSLVARELKRKRTDCIIHYYCWKGPKGARGNSSYRKMKQDWKNEWCCVCDDGGDLIICDQCDLAYHPECVTPPLDKIPKGDWYCPSCKGERTAARFSPSSPMAGPGRKPRVERKRASKVRGIRNNEDEDDITDDKSNTRKRLFGSIASSPLSQHGPDRCIVGSHSLDVGQTEERKPSKDH